MAIVEGTAQVDSGTGIEVDVVEANLTPAKMRQVFVIGSPDKADAHSVISKVTGTNPGANDVGLVVRLPYGEVNSFPLKARLTDGGDDSSIDGSGNLHIAVRSGITTASVLTAAPVAAEPALAVRPVHGATAALAAFAKVTNGTNVQAVDASGNASVKLGVALDRTSRVGLSDANADQFAEIGADNVATTNLLAVKAGLVRSAVPSLTATRAAGLWLLPTGELVGMEGPNRGTPTTGQVSVTSTATVIKATNANRANIKITNTHATETVFYGYTSGVTISTGMSLPAGAAVKLRSVSGVWGITASGTATVTFDEENVV